jgi:UDP-GlcNAc:undecaprenyl-phosphate/decaprenyl-phosphate GlcNAc-1-phosphate transferase
LPYSLSLALAAAAVALAVTPAVIARARRAGALDHPGPRRIHREPVPTLGGIALVVAVLGVAWGARLLPGPAAALDVRPLLGLTVAAIPMVALGVVDDLRGVGPWTKLAVQSVAGLILVAFGYGVPVLTNPLRGSFESGVFNIPLTVGWVLLVTNAINLIDGLDGLAAGAVLIGSVTLWWVGRSHADFYVMFIAALLIGGTFGFLCFNFPPARVFMGDTGSHFLGITLAAVSLLENRKGTAAVTLLLPIVALAVPIVDGSVAFLRRLVRGRPVFHGDVGHIHHRLLRLGLSPRLALLVLWGVCALCGAMAALLSALPHDAAAPLALLLAVILFAALVWVRARDRGPGGGVR